VRELCERGDNTLALPARDAARAGAAVFALVRVFFATGNESGTKISFSLSDAIWIGEDFLFLPFAGDCWALVGEVFSGERLCGSGGSGRSRAAACLACVRVP
jgi:hypothetical protein